MLQVILANLDPLSDLGIQLNQCLLRLPWHHLLRPDQDHQCHLLGQDFPLDPKGQ